MLLVRRLCEVPRSPAWPGPLLALALLTGCGGGLTELSAPPLQPPPPPPLPGTEAARISPTEVDIGHHFSASQPLIMELTIPAGVIIGGRGLPPEFSQTGPLAEGYTPAQDLSVVQIELPSSPAGETDEERQLASVGQFDPPRLCRVGSRPCLWRPEDDGRWRAWRIRTGPTGDRVNELQLAHAWQEDGSAGFGRAIQTVVTLWMPVGSTLIAGDRVRFSYVGDAPRRSTDWLDDAGATLRPRLRYRPSTSPPTICPAADAACWVELQPTEVQGLVLRALEPAWLQVLAPLDVPAGTELGLRLVARDRHANPARLSADLQLQIDGVDVVPVPMLDAWEASVVAPALLPGLHALTVSGAGAVSVLPQWVHVADPGEPVRLLGDVHVHSGVEGDTGFSRSGAGGDHRGNFTRTWDALRYLREVAGADFGAIAEHAMRTASWSATGGMPEFGPGGLCEVVMDPPHGVRDDWWQASQDISRAFQAANPGFTTFPAYEWHGSLQTPTHQAALHRVVLFRDHVDPGQTHAMLPGSQDNRLPACLFRWLDGHGYDPSQVLVMPHMMYADPLNDDWDLTYNPPPGALTIAVTDGPERYQRIGEIFSARAYAGTDGSPLVRFEGDWLGDAGAQPYTWRHAWRDLSVVIGVIGSSDNHTQMPGADDPWTGPDGTSYHGHEPGGAAVVLTDPTKPTRDAIHDAMYERRTYGTSGIRAWLDFGLTAAGLTHPMGSEVGPLAACSAELTVELAAPAPIHTLTVWSTTPGSAAPWLPVLDLADGQVAHLTGSAVVTNPVGPGQPALTTMYYVRASTGPETLPGEAATALHADAVWSSPIWVTWEGASCP